MAVKKTPAKKPAAKKPAAKKTTPAKKPAAKNAKPAAGVASPSVLEPGREYIVPIMSIRPDPNQPRKDFDLVTLTALATSMRAAGRPTDPIKVRPDPGHLGHIIVDGERRWRASRLNEFASVPIVLDPVWGSTAHEASLAATASMDLMLDQAMVNEQREPLNALEWGQMFQKMHEAGESDAKIQAALEARGISDKGRAYISNLRRLMNLPDWAKDMIREGRLSGAQGKYLLQGVCSDPVMKRMEKALQAKGANAIETVGDLQDAMRRAFEENHTPLDRAYVRIGNQWQNRHFDPKKTCKGCDKQVSVTDEARPFCLDENCFKKHVAEGKKNADAKAKAALAASKEKMENAPQCRPDPAPVTVLEGNLVNIDDHELEEGFDYVEFRPASRFARLVLAHTCAECGHRHSVTDNDAEPGDGANDACFNPSCYFAKQEAFESREKADAENYRHIADHLRGQLAAQAEANPALQRALYVYLAIARPYVTPEARKAIKAIEESYGVSSRSRDDTFAAFLAAGKAEELTGPAVSVIVLMLGDKKLRTLADFLGQGIESLLVNEQFLKGKTREEVVAMLSEANVIGAVLDEAHACKTDKEIRALALEHAEDIGVPREIEEAWETFGIENDDDAEEDEPEDAGEDQAEMFPASGEETADAEEA